MRHVRAAVARIAGIFNGHRADDELLEELEAHLEMATAENLRRGMGPREARRQAMLASGGLAQAAEAIRDQRGLPSIEGIAADVRYAVRALRHSSAFTAVVVITLALGIGANTAIFSVVHGVLLKPLPYRDGNRLVWLRHSIDGPGGTDIGLSVPEVRDLRNGAPSLAGIAEYSGWTLVHLSDDGAARISVHLVSGNYFEVMGLSPVLGRLIRPSDDGPGVPPVAVLTYEYWNDQLGGDPTIVGKSIRLDDQDVAIIGVLEPAPFFPNRIDALLNLVISEHHLSATMVEGRTHRMSRAVARLAPGAPLERARDEVAAVQTRMHSDFQEAYDPGSHHRVTVIPFKQVLGERARLTLWLLMGAAAFVLVIAGANVANLTLMRGVRREHELVVRAALGAGVARLRRLLLVENLLLTLMGGVLGVIIARAGIRLLTSFAARYSPRAGDIRLDASVLGFALVLAVTLALLLAFVAALPKEGSLGSAIAAGVRRMSRSLRRQRLQRGLVVVQVAASVVLLAGAGLLTRTLMQLADVDTGLTTEEVLTMQVPLFNATDRSARWLAADAAAKGRYERMRREIAALPGVIEVGVGSPMPLRPGISFDVRAEGRSLAAGEAIPRADIRIASPEYFRAAGIPLVQGREFATTDQWDSDRMVIINRTLADRLFPGQDALERRIAWTGDVLRFGPFSDDWRTIVGIAGNTQDGGLDAEPRPAVFMPLAQELASVGGLVIRAESDAAALAGEATRIIRRIAPTAPIENVMTIPQLKAHSLSPRRLNAALVSSFGTLAVIIAAVGIAGVLAFSVRTRTNEIGIRMSLGADRGRVQRMFLREGGLLLAIGLILGAAGAFFAGRVMDRLLFGVAPHDPVTLIGVTAMMVVIGLAACWIPALHASRVDPAIAMRS